MTTVRRGDQRPVGDPQQKQTDSDGEILESRMAVKTCVCWTAPSHTGGASVALRIQFPPESARIRCVCRLRVKSAP